MTKQETMRRIEAVAAYNKMSTDTVTGYDRACRNKEKAVALFKSGLVTDTEAINIAKG